MSGPAPYCAACHAAINHEFRTRHVTGRVRSEELDTLGDILRLSHAAERDPRFPGVPAHATSDQLPGQEVQVKRVNLADAKAYLSELVERAAAGEAVCITRRGKAVAQITAIDTPRKRIDPAVLRAMTDTMPVQPQTARDFIRRMRDDDRF